MGISTGFYVLKHNGTLDMNMYAFFIFSSFSMWVFGLYAMTSWDVSIILCARLGFHGLN